MGEVGEDKGIIEDGSLAVLFMPCSHSEKKQREQKMRKGERKGRRGILVGQETKEVSQRV